MISLIGCDNHIFDVKQNHFPDGTLHLEPMQHFPSQITQISWHYENDAELFSLICLRRKYANQEVTLLLPYIPHARVERVKNDDDVFTLKYFAEVINSLNFKEVVVLDPHSNVSAALIDRIRIVEPISQIDTAIHQMAFEITHETGHEHYLQALEQIVLFFPDEGAMKRYSAYTPLPYAFGLKKRDWATGKIQGLQLINGDLVKGKNVLIVDDICSRGGTFLHSAKALKEAGANRIFLYVTHAEKTMVEGEMYNNLDLVERIYTTNSIFKLEWDDRNKVTIVN